MNEMLGEYSACRNGMCLCARPPEKFLHSVVPSGCSLHGATISFASKERGIEIYKRYKFFPHKRKEIPKSAS